MDADDPKATLIALIVELVSSRGPADQILSALLEGGEAAADAVSDALDHAMDVLEQVSVSSPRKSRRSVRELLESVEELSEVVNAAWCDGVSRCGADRLEDLASRVVSVRAVVSEKAAPESVPIVSSLLESLRECGSVAVQCSSVLSVGSGSGESARIAALECVRGLSAAGQGKVNDPEASLFGVVLDHLCTAEAMLSCHERLLCWRSLFTLGCRNGVSVVARVEVLEPMVTAMRARLLPLSEAVHAGDMDDEMHTTAAASLCAWGLAGYEAGAKCAPTARVPYEACMLQTSKHYMDDLVEMFAELGGKVLERVVE